VSTLNWRIFENLPGSQSSNFESLCRALIRVHFGRFGQFAALANQPGVEFHLHLPEDCALGKKGQWFGWQCRWYGIPSGTPIGSARRKKIEEALNTSLKEIPELTDWVLWTRYPLTKGDQQWFQSLISKITLHQWTSSEVETYLSGDATILRGTYFGEFVLTPASLRESQKESSARIKQRWFREVHQIVGAERTIRQMLGEPYAWDRLQTTRDEIGRFLKSLQQPGSKPPKSLRPLISELQISGRSFKNAIGKAQKAIAKGNREIMLQFFHARPRADHRKSAQCLRLLRSAQSPSALFATNLVASIRDADLLLATMADFFEVRIVAVLAGPGGGKTQLAAELTIENQTRAAGVLLHGQDLGAHGTMDDLAHTVKINGVPVPSAEALAAAVDAAGTRSERRLPIIIDGLNEAEDPRRWKSLIASFDETLRKYPYVLLVCTVRTEDFADESLPQDVRRLEIPDFGEDAIEAIRKYFQFFKINAADLDLPMDMLGNPLTLRLFCEVTNPKREKVVGIEAIPGSLAALFERYIEKAAERIFQLSVQSHRYYPQDVSKAINELGIALWEANSRGIEEKDFRKRIDDDSRPWDHSLVRALQQEGLILRGPGMIATSGDRHFRAHLRTLGVRADTSDSSEMRIAPVYDAFGGHIIADALALRTGFAGIGILLADPEVLAKIHGEYGGRHPLAGDIVTSLAGILPRRIGRQLWPLVDGALRTRSLIEATKLEASYVDAATVDEIRSLLSQTDGQAWNIFTRLFRARAAINHPLNAEFLDSVLRQMSMADRDLGWTEWIRSNREGLTQDIEEIESIWRQQSERYPSSGLRATWIKWLLTSTVRSLRDKATRVLYWYGRRIPNDLFKMTLESLSINDTYVWERMLAASYGTAMALHGRPEEDEFRTKTLPQYAQSLFRHMFAKDAPQSTTHALARDYASHTIHLALHHHRRLLSNEDKERVHPPFPGSKRVPWGKVAAKYDGGFRGPIHMDFGNYTIGGLVESRGNYDYSNEEYQDVVRSILWRIYNLGYEEQRFEIAEKQIYDGDWRHGRSPNGGKIERYGKKYSWIAYFEMAGQRGDDDKLKECYGENGRLSDIDIDPSFPDPVTERPLIMAKLPKLKTSLSKWLQQTHLPPLKTLLIQTNLPDFPGDWVLLDGYFHQRDAEQSIGLSCFIRNLLLKSTEYSEFCKLLRNKVPFTDRNLNKPTFHYTFAGEAPWADKFPACGKIELVFEIGKKMVRRKRDHLDDFLSEIPSDNAQDKGGLRSPHSKYVLWQQPVFREIEALIPAVGNGWESYHTVTNPGDCAPWVARELCAPLRLCVDAQKSAFYDRNGKGASLVIKGEFPCGASHELLFLRKDLYESFLHDHEMKGLWMVTGERELYTRDTGDLHSLYQMHGTPLGFQGALRYPSASRAKTARHMTALHPSTCW
jgi:hypothetical protein